MQVVILAGGKGTRISEETETKPKPMVLIGGKPIIWHLMNSYADQGFNEFIVATGYLGHVIDSWATALKSEFRITVLDTGEETLTGGRVRQVISLIKEDNFMLTYGDGLSDVNLQELVEFHSMHGKVGTVTAVRPPARFGVIESFNGLVTHFAEKNQTDVGRINGGFFVLNKTISTFINSDHESFEAGALTRLTESQGLMAFEHDGFWHPMDTLRDKNELTKLALEENPPWRKYKR